MARKKELETAAVETATMEDLAGETATTENIEAFSEKTQTTAQTIKPDNEIKKIYVGASVPGIKSHTVFTGDIPKVLDIPFVRELCIDVDKLTVFLKKKAVTSSREAFCYRKSVELAKELKK